MPLRLHFQQCFLFLDVQNAAFWFIIDVHLVDQMQKLQHLRG